MMFCCRCAAVRPAYKQDITPPQVRATVVYLGFCFCAQRRTRACRALEVRFLCCCILVCVLPGSKMQAYIWILVAEVPLNAAELQPTQGYTTL